MKHNLNFLLFGFVFSGLLTGCTTVSTFEFLRPRSVSPHGVDLSRFQEFVIGDITYNAVNQGVRSPQASDAVRSEMKQFVEDTKFFNTFDNVRAYQPQPNLPAVVLFMNIEVEDDWPGQITNAPLIGPGGILNNGLLNGVPANVRAQGGRPQAQPARVRKGSVWGRISVDLKPYGSSANVIPTRMISLIPQSDTSEATFDGREPAGIDYVKLRNAAIHNTLNEVAKDILPIRERVQYQREDQGQWPEVISATNKIQAKDYTGAEQEIRNLMKSGANYDKASPWKRSYAYFILGLSLEKQKKPKEAYDSYDQALKLYHQGGKPFTRKIVEGMGLYLNPKHNFGGLDLSPDYQNAMQEAAASMNAVKK